MLRVLVAPDSFKGTADAASAAAAILRGWRQARPDDEVRVLPLADGGEGTLDVLRAARPLAVQRFARVSGPALDEVRAGWLELPDGAAAVELAGCAGLSLMPHLDALGATTQGLGQLLGVALDGGARRLLIALGGSASTDGATGALTALGARFLDARGQVLPPGGGALARLASIDLSQLRPPPIGGVDLLVDVSAPLLGDKGAARTFGPQKGASPAQVGALESGLATLAQLLGGDVDQPGAGAAGGTAYGLAAAWGARLVPGARFVADLVGLQEAIAVADVLVLGEGRFDATSMEGKVVGNALAMVGNHQRPRVGLVTGELAVHPVPGIDVAVSMSELAGGAAAARARPLHWLAEAGRRMAREFAPPAGLSGTRTPKEDLMNAGTWQALAPHRAWLAAERGRLLDFAERSTHPDGGFSWLDERGAGQSHLPVESWITCRMTHVFSLAHLEGRPGAGALADVGIAALNGVLRDKEHGGWYASARAAGPVVADKRAYEHSFVVLAASSAAAAGRPGAERLLSEALDTFETRFWREDDGMFVDVWDRGWTELEPYRGVNANMHAVEACLAAADVTGKQVWRDRAARIVERVVHGFARENSWWLCEHYDEHWAALPGYNASEPAHAFRPYGVTAGHLFEWARLALHLRASLELAAPGSAPNWLLDDAAALFDRAVSSAWAVDGAEGFVYTTDFAGAPVVADRLHWVLTEAIAAAAALHEVTSESVYEQCYRGWWDHAAQHFIDKQLGSWRHELTPDLRPSSVVWDGKPDIYHALQATLVPELPLAPSFATALRDRLRAAGAAAD